MAILAKKLYIRLANGTQWACKAYSTIGEANNRAIYTVMDGTQGYVAIGSTGDRKATNGRVSRSDGTWAILHTATPNYGAALYTSNGTFTVPANVYKLRVTCVGGGAGGAIFPGWNTYGNYGVNYTMYGYAGGNTGFGSYVAGGGTRQISQGSAYYDSGEAPSYHYVQGAQISSYGANNGGLWCCNEYGSYGGGAAVALTNYAGTNYGNYGAGGYADGNGDTVMPGASGYKGVWTINVTPGQAIGYYIGGGGAFSWMGTSHGGGNTGGRGGSVGQQGAILVEWGRGIE